MKSKISLNIVRAKANLLAAAFAWLDSRPRSKSRGVALVEIAISLPVALTIVLGSVHISTVLRESNIILEAARHGARSGAAQSTSSDPDGTFPALWTGNLDSITNSCDSIHSKDRISNEYGHYVAITAACSYLAASNPGTTGARFNPADWNVSVQIISRLNADLSNTAFISVRVFTNDARGSVDSLKSFFNIRPSYTSVFPIMRLLN